MCEVELWNQGTFRPGKWFLADLESALKRFDFAVIVLTADDYKISRDETKPADRDNLIFELGFFTAGLGRERTFMVWDRKNRPDLPSDLDGITAVTYEEHSSGNIKAALGAACFTIQEEIERLALRVMFGTFTVSVEPVRAIINTGLTEPTGSLRFKQLSEVTNPGYIIISYGLPVTVPWQNVRVVGSGGLAQARLEQDRCSHSAGLITIKIPAGGRTGDTISVEGVRVAVAGTALTSLAASIAMEGNTMPPGDSYVQLAKAIAPGIAGIEVKSCVLDTTSLPASAHGELMIKEGFLGSFVGSKQIAAGITNGTEFVLSISGLLPEIDFLN